jgi:hypothetical protein
VAGPHAESNSYYAAHYNRCVKEEEEDGGKGERENERERKRERER